MSTPEDRIEALERKVAALYEHLGMAEPGNDPAPASDPAPPADHTTVPPAAGGTVHLDGRVLDAIQAGNVIEAIKIQRETTGQDLATAKATVDEIVEMRRAMGL